MEAKKNSKMTLFISILWLVLLIARNNIVEPACSAKERKSLLTIKQSLNDSNGFLSSWVGEDCCDWFGVECENQTSHVTKLDLHGRYVCDALSCKELRISGTFISDSLLDLEHLTYLDLNGNDFRGVRIPDFLGSLRNLSHLDLSSSSFEGEIPPSIGNLSKLQYLNLLSFTSNLWVPNFHWIAKLSSLRYLNLGGTNIRKRDSSWIHFANNLSYLEELHLINCRLPSLSQSHPLVNPPPLRVLDLTYNYLKSEIPSWIFNLSTLVDLSLSRCKLRGNIPVVPKGNLCNLKNLDMSGNFITGEVSDFMDALSECFNSSLVDFDLSDNKLEGNLPMTLGSFKYLENFQLSRNSLSGKLPKTIGNLSNLSMLDLSFNKFSGKIPESIRRLTRLSDLSLWGNYWQGIISDVHLQNLTKLSRLSLSSVNWSLVFKMKPGWLPLFNMLSIEINECGLGPAFPEWLRFQTDLDTLTLRNCGVSGVIPHWLWKLQLFQLDLSSNNLSGELPNSTSFTNGSYVRLGFNQLQGSLPIWPNTWGLSLTNNLLSGPIPKNIGSKMSTLYALDLSSNSLNGRILSSIRDMKGLFSLDLSSNKFTGDLLEDWTGLEMLQNLDLSHNKFSGGISSSLCSQIPELFWLDISGNALSGDLLFPLKNCTELVGLSLGFNKFSGTFPALIDNAKDFVPLSYLNLQGNMLHGNIPESLCYFPFLHVIDLAHNNLSGKIPNCLGDSEPMKSPMTLDVSTPSTQQLLVRLNELELVVKGKIMRYAETISIVNLIDLSSNNLCGEIPKEMTNLSRIGYLNLSRNHLTGKIPKGIEKLKLLESLDLSWNSLTGHIPPEMSSMTFLNYLNLSHNKLYGQIPFTNQFSTFIDPSIYEANLGLCGPPLPINCSSSKNNGNSEEEEEDRHMLRGFIVSIASGYVVGFLVGCVTLVINKSLRNLYFKSADAVKEKIIVYIAIRTTHFRRDYNMT